MVLPQQVGIDLGVLNYKTGAEYRHGLLQPQFHNAPVVRMGHHAYDGSFSSISFANSNVNFTVESAIEKSASALGTDNVVAVSTNASAADATNLAVVVHPSAFWGAAANITFVDADPPRLELDSGELGVVSITFSHPASPLNQKDPTALVFNVTTEAPLVLWFTFEAAKADPDYAVASKVIEVQRAVVIADIQAAATLSKSSFDVSDAMASAIAWNVNFDPRVAVTAPVSRTFEAGFDFIFFDVSRSTGCSTEPCWLFSLPSTESGTLTSHYPHASQWDMFFLSLMASSMPAANNPHAFAIGVSNLIEVAQTRSAYGQVMNKRAASGSSTSDTNDRTEPYVPPLLHACSAKPPMLLQLVRPTLAQACVLHCAVPSGSPGVVLTLHPSHHSVSPLAVLWARWLCSSCGRMPRDHRGRRRCSGWSNSSSRRCCGGTSGAGRAVGILDQAPAAASLFWAQITTSRVKDRQWDKTHHDRSAQVLMRPS